MKRVLVEVEIAEGPHEPHPELVCSEMVEAARVQSVDVRVLQARVFDERDITKPEGAS